MVLSGVMPIISFNIPFTSIRLTLLLSKYILLKCLISLIRGERSKLLVRLLWTCQEIIVHAKQNKLQYIIHNNLQHQRGTNQ